MKSNRYTLERSKVLVKTEYEAVYELWNGRICVIPEYQFSRALSRPNMIFTSRMSDSWDRTGFMDAEPLELVEIIDEIGIPRRAVICDKYEISSVIRLFRDEIANLQNRKELYCG